MPGLKQWRTDPGIADTPDGIRTAVEVTLESRSTAASQTKPA
jgi:hypothetical protein